MPIVKQLYILAVNAEAEQRSPCLIHKYIGVGVYRMRSAQIIRPARVARARAIIASATEPLVSV